MELRKRTRTAAAKVIENKHIDAVAPTPRKTRKTRRPASTSSPGAENDSQQGSQQGGQAETSMDLSKSAGVEALGGLYGTELAKSELGVDGSISQKDEPNGEDKVVEHDTVEGTHDDGNISKKRRKVITTASQEIESQDTVSESVNNVGIETQESKDSAEADDETKLDTHEGENRASVSCEGRSLEEAPSGPSGELRSNFIPGVELPIQPHKRKDVHTGPGIGVEPETLLSEATAKRPRRSSDEETIVEDTSSIKGSPAKRGRKKIIKNDPPSRSEVEMPEIPTPPTRKRGRPQITYKEESDEDENEPVYLPPKASPRRNKKKDNIGAGTNNEVVEQAAPKGRKGRRNIWDKEVLLTSKKSRLATAADLSDVLNAITWSLLTPEEQKECLALLPSIDKVYAPPEPLNPSADPNGEPLLAPDFFESNQVFKDSLVEFQDDLSQGRYESSYIKDAANARKARLEGVVDKYKDGLYELYWGQRQHNGMVAGAAAQIKLPELIQKGLLKAGDVWVYKRTLIGTPTIEKEVKVMEVAEISNNKADEKKKIACLVFHIPPGNHKFSHPSRADIVLEGVTSPSTVEKAILSTHPDTPAKIPNGNAFKVFNIWRKGEDLGLLWEIRQTYWGGE